MKEKDVKRVISQVWNPEAKPLTWEDFERAIRDDECRQIMNGFRNTRQQNLHDYLDKRMAKRAKRAP